MSSRRNCTEQSSSVFSNEVSHQEPKTFQFFPENCSSSGGPISQSTPGKKIEFTIGSEPDSPGGGFKKQPREGFGEFLRACYLCNKRLKEDQQVYMYGYLGAFCSISCQERQMGFDGFHQQFRKETAQTHSKGPLSKRQH